MITVTGTQKRGGNWIWAAYSDVPTKPLRYFTDGKEHASFTYEISEGRKIDVLLTREEVEAALRCFT